MSESAEKATSPAASSGSTAECTTPASDPQPSSDGSEEAQGGASAEASRGAAPAVERSHWGLFERTVSVVREGNDAYKSLVYQCTPDQTVEFRQPIGGAGTTLMHGDFARKLSPSEEAMATYVIKHKKMFKNKRVLDVGAGLGFAGLVCATCAQPSSLELSDGDPEVCSTLRSSVQLNLASFGNTRVNVRKVLWDRSEEWADRESFDVVIAADVVYLDFLHAPLLGMISRVLKPGGLFLLWASRRNGSLEKFIFNAKAFFPTVEATTDYDAEVAKAIGKTTKCFPVMVRLVAAENTEELPAFVSTLCEEMREKRAMQEKEAAAAEKQRKKEQAKHRARSESLVEHRKRRLEAREAEEERLAAEAAAEAAAAAVVEEAKPRVPTVSQAEQEGRSDWGLFTRQCTMSSDGAYKDMVYEVSGRNVSIRRPLSTVSGDSRKVSASEEVLTMWAAKQRRFLKRKRVLELGAGSGLAGLAVAACTTAKHVEITDGDPNALAMLRVNLDLNGDGFSAKKVAARQIVFGEDPDGIKQFDCILAADVLDTDVPALLKTLRRLLKASGTAIIFASPNNSALESFVAAAKPIFDRIDVSRHYDEDVTRALHGMSCFPKMIRLQRSDAFLPKASIATAPCKSLVDGERSAGTAAVRPSSRVSNDAARGENCTENRPLEPGDRRRQILAKRGRLRAAKRTEVVATPSGDAEAAASSDSCPEADTAACNATADESRLPSLAGSRSSSTSSMLLASEISSLAYGARLNAADNGAASAYRSPERKALPPSLPGPVASSSSTIAVTSMHIGKPSVAPACEALGSFWARIPNSAGAGFQSGGVTEVVADAAQDPPLHSAWPRGSSLQGRRSSSLPPQPPAGNGKPPACLLGLVIDGSAMAIQRCAGTSARGKLRAGRCISREPPRIPVVCS